MKKNWEMTILFIRDIDFYHHLPTLTTDLAGRAAFTISCKMISAEFLAKLPTLTMICHMQHLENVVLLQKKKRKYGH